MNESFWELDKVFKRENYFSVVFYHFIMGELLISKTGMCTHNKSIADVGGGIGYIGKNLASGSFSLRCGHIVDIPERVVVLENSDDMLSFGKQRFRQLSNLEYRKFNLADPLQEDLREQFDIIISISVIHNLDYSQQPKAFENLLSLAKPNGEFLYVDVILEDTEYELIQELKSNSDQLTTYVLDRSLEVSTASSLPLGNAIYPHIKQVILYNPILSPINTLRDEYPLRVTDVRTMLHNSGFNIISEGDVPGFAFFKYFYSKRVVG